jgi:cell division protein FtsB
MKWIALIFLTMLFSLQVRLWSDDGGIAELNKLEKISAEQQLANQRLKARNAELKTQVKALRNDPVAIEHYARIHLGMIKPDETFYRFLPSQRP